MSTEAQAGRSTDSGIESLQKGRGLTVVLGFALMVMGLLAMAATPFLAGLAAVFWVAVLLLIGGVSQIAQSFICRKWKGFLVHLLVGILYLVLGLMFVRRPGVALEALTMMIAIVLMVGGLFRGLVSLLMRFEQWGWTFIGGLISLGLGIVIWVQLPWSAMWLIGTFVGIDMLCTGWSLVMLSGVGRKALKEA